MISVIFLLSMIFLIKNPILNQLVICSTLNLLNKPIQTKGDISTSDDGLTHVGRELAVAGDKIIRMGDSSYNFHHKICLSQYINYQQSGQSTAT